MEFLDDGICSNGSSPGLPKTHIVLLLLPHETRERARPLASPAIHISHVFDALLGGILI